MNNTSKKGRVVLDDGTEYPLTDQQVSRTAYALASLALTPIIDHLKITGLYDSNGTLFWPPQ